MNRKELSFIKEIAASYFDSFPRILNGEKIQADLTKITQFYQIELINFPFSKNILGVTLFFEKSIIIGLNSKLKEENFFRYHFTLAHEVSEFILKKSYKNFESMFFNEKYKETACNFLASSLLMPDKVFRERIINFCKVYEGIFKESPENILMKELKNPALIFKAQEFKIYNEDKKLFIAFNFLKELQKVFLVSREAILIKIGEVLK